MKCTTDWEAMYKLCLKESQAIEQDLATAKQEATAYRISLENLENSLPKIKADAVLDFGHNMAHEMCDEEYEIAAHNWANKLEAGE